jgi:hypothetical protein
MNSTAIVEQVVRKGWAGADGSTLDELVSSGRVASVGGGWLGEAEAVRCGRGLTAAGQA